MTKNALIVLTKGFEEIEAVTTIDLLRRAQIKVTIATPDDERLVFGRSNIAIQAETDLSTALEANYDALILPGGPGVKTLINNSELIEALQRHNESNALIAAICAAPTILYEAGLLQDRQYTAHHSTHAMIPDIIQEEAVVHDGNIITSPGAGTTLDFAFAIIANLIDAETADTIREDIHYNL